MNSNVSWRKISTPSRWWKTETVTGSSKFSNYSRYNTSQIMDNDLEEFQWKTIQISASKVTLFWVKKTSIVLHNSSFSPCKKLCLQSDGYTSTHRWHTCNRVWCSASRDEQKNDQVDHFPVCHCAIGALNMSAVRHPLIFDPTVKNTCQQCVSKDCPWELARRTVQPSWNTIYSTPYVKLVK